MEKAQDFSWEKAYIANERMLLSYSRTSLFLAASGIFILGFLPLSAGRAVGGALLILAFVLVALGVRHYRFIAKRLGRLKQTHIRVPIED